MEPRVVYIAELPSGMKIPLLEGHTWCIPAGALLHKVDAHLHRVHSIDHDTSTITFTFKPELPIHLL